MSAGAFMNGESDLPHILASLRALLTPTEQLPGQQSASQNLLLTVPQQQHGMPAAANPNGGTGSGGGSGASSLLSDGQTLSHLASLLGGGPSLAAFASGVPADAAVASTLAPTVTSELGTTAASIEAANNAALASQLASEGIAPAASSAAPAAAPAGGSLAGAAATALPLAFAGWAGYNALHEPTNNGWGIGSINDLLSGVKSGTQAGTISPGTAGLSAPAGALNLMSPNGTVNQPALNAFQSLYQSELGNFGQATPYVQQQLNSLGYQNAQQALQGKWAGGMGGSSLANLLQHQR